MKVKVRLLGLLELLPYSEDVRDTKVDAADGATLKGFLNQLFSKINEKSKGTVFNVLDCHGDISPNLSITINGRSVSDSDSLDQKLKEGDYIQLFAATGG